MLHVEIEGSKTVYFERKAENYAYYVNYAQQHCHAFPKKTYTLVGFEPRPSGCPLRHAIRQKTMYGFCVQRNKIGRIFTLLAHFSVFGGIFFFKIWHKDFGSNLFLKIAQHSPA
jgi:hypothetical protein